MKSLIKSLRQQNALILDTETTGLDGRAEILQIGICTLDGEEVLHTLVQPAKARSWPAAQGVHGLSWTDVQNAPTIHDLAGELRQFLDGRQVAIFNADYDTRLLKQSIRAANAQSQYTWLQMRGWPCIMKAYAAYYGQRDTRYGSYRWQSLDKACHQQGIRVSNAHNALADAQMTAALLRKIEEKYS